TTATSNRARHTLMSLQCVDLPNANQFSCGVSCHYSTKLLHRAASYNSSLGIPLEKASRLAQQQASKRSLSLVEFNGSAWLQVPMRRAGHQEVNNGARIFVARSNRFTERYNQRPSIAA